MILSGEAGIGKTRLAEEMAAWVSWQGMTTASAHCYAAEGRLAYAPVTAWLHEAVVQTGLPALADVWFTEVARLAPEVLVKQPKLPRPIPKAPHTNISCIVELQRRSRECMQETWM